MREQPFASNNPCGWSPRVAIQMIRRLSEFNIFFAEQPVPRDDVSWLVDVRRNVPVIHLAMSTPGISAEGFPCDIIGPFYYEDDWLAEPLPPKAAKRDRQRSRGWGWNWTRRK